MPLSTGNMQPWPIYELLMAYRRVRHARGGGLPVHRAHRQLPGSRLQSCAILVLQPGGLPHRVCDTGAMADDRVRAAVEHWAPRFVAGGVDPGDFARITAAIDSWDDWCAAWSEA